MLPASLLSSDLNVGGLVLDVEGLGLEGLLLDVVGRGLDVTALFLVERDPRMAPAWLLNLYLDVEGLEEVVVALFLLVEWGLDLCRLPCPGSGRICA